MKDFLPQSCTEFLHRVSQRKTLCNSVLPITSVSLCGFVFCSIKLPSVQECDHRFRRGKLQVKPDSSNIAWLKIIPTQIANSYSINKILKISTSIDQLKFRMKCYGPNKILYSFNRWRLSQSIFSDGYFLLIR